MDGDENLFVSPPSAVNISNFAVSLLNNATDVPSTLANLQSLNLFPKVPVAISVLYLTLIVITLVIGVPGNAVVSVAYHKVKNKSACDWYIFFVALSDLLSCLFRVTGYLLEYMGLWAAYTNSGYCKLMTWISQTTVCMGNLLFALIALDRFAKICAIPKLSMNSKQARNLCLLLNVVTLVLAAPCLYLFENLPRGVCHIKPSFVKSKWVAGYYSTMFILFLVMMVIVVMCYARVFTKIRGTRKIFTQEPVAPSQGDEPHHTDITAQTSSGHSDKTNDRSSASFRKLDASTSQADVQEVGQNSVSTMISDKDVSQLKIPSARQSHRFEVKFQQGRKSGRIKLPKQQEVKLHQRQRRDFRITGLLFLVTIVFIISWIPPYAAMIQGFYIGYTFPLSFADYLLMTYAPTIFMVNNFANPLIYVCLSATFRQNVKELFQCRAR